MPPPDSFSFSGQAAFEALAAAIAEAVVVVEPDGRVAFADEGLLAELGRAEDEVVGRPLLDLLDPEAAVRSEPGGFWTAPPPFEREFQMRTADGAWVWARARSTAIDGDGRRPAAVARALGERALLLVRLRSRGVASADARRLLQAALDGAPYPMGVVELGADGLRHQAANEAALALYRAPGDRASEAAAAADWPRGAPLANLGVPADEAACWAAHVRACAEAGEPVRFRTVFPWGAAPDAPGARRLDVAVAGGGGGLFVYVVEDATERRAAERERRLLAAAVEQAAEAIVVTDTRATGEGPRILYANRAHQRIFGYPLDEILGRSPRMFQGPKTDRVVLDRIRRALAAGESVEAEAVNYRKDGSEFMLQWEIAPVKDAEGRVVNWVGTQRDVTERRQLESQVLEASVREQERLAREIHDGLGQVLTGAAFRLQALRQLLRDIGQEHLADDANRTRQIVTAAHEQARAIAHGLAPVAVELDGLRVALARLAEDVGQAYGIRCTFRTDDALSVGNGEQAGHLYRIAQEAIANAARHGRAQTVAVALLPADDGVRLTVEDDGSGISAESLEHSRGLGLRTMRYRADRVGGVLAIGARDGGGTRVAVSFRPAAKG